MHQWRISGQRGGPGTRATAQSHLGAARVRLWCYPSYTHRPNRQTPPHGSQPPFQPPGAASPPHPGPSHPPPPYPSPSHPCPPPCHGPGGGPPNRHRADVGTWVGVCDSGADSRRAGGKASGDCQGGDDLYRFHCQSTSFRVSPGSPSVAVYSGSGRGRTTALTPPGTGRDRVSGFAASFISLARINRLRRSVRVHLEMVGAQGHQPLRQRPGQTWTR